MSQLAHRIYVYTLAGIVLFTAVFLMYKGLPYYSTSLEERFYHPDHDFYKPSGAFGHGLGIIGTLLILIGVFSYMARKRYRSLARLGRLKYWLEFHIFLCSLGPIMILYHTAFKFGGIVSVSFWSMVAVVASGIIGRFIYIQIPRTIEGRELSLVELREMRSDVEKMLSNSYGMSEVNYRQLIETAQTDPVPQSGNLVSRMFRKYLQDRKTVKQMKQTLQEHQMSKENIKKVARLVKNELSLGNRIARLQTMRQLFKYWHVAHLPFALIMLVIMVIHVAVTLAFGYRWIF